MYLYFYTTKERPMDQEKIFANQISGKRLISKINKKLLEFNSKKHR